MDPDKVQSLKNQEGLLFSSHHHSLLIHDTHSARENPAHVVSLPQGSLRPLLNPAMPALAPLFMLQSGGPRISPRVHPGLPTCWPCLGSPFPKVDPKLLLFHV